MYISVHALMSRAFNTFQVYQYFTIYRQYFFIIIWTIVMNILYNTLEHQEVPKTILGG